MYDIGIDISAIALFQNSFILPNPLVERTGHTNNHLLLTGVFMKLIRFAWQEFNINEGYELIDSSPGMT